MSAIAIGVITGTILVMIFAILIVGLFSAIAVLEAFVRNHRSHSGGGTTTPHRPAQTVI